MKRRLTWEKREVANVRHYWVVGERFPLEDREDGWYVSSWSDSVPVIGYWVTDGRFYQALMNWVTPRTMDLEIIREIRLDQERERITLEAIDEWKNHREDRIFAHAAMDESVFDVIAA